MDSFDENLTTSNLRPATPTSPAADCGSMTPTTQTVIEGDCLTYMRNMPTRSIAVIVTSPPYNLGKRYSLHKDTMLETDYLAWQGDVAKEITRILRPDGHLFLNAGSDSAHPRRAEDVAIAYERYMITLGHFVSLNSDCFLNPCWEPVFHFTRSGHSPINRLAIGVP